MLEPLAAQQQKQSSTTATTSSTNGEGQAAVKLRRSPEGRRSRLEPYLTTMQDGPAQPRWHSRGLTMYLAAGPSSQSYKCQSSPTRTLIRVYRIIVLRASLPVVTDHTQARFQMASFLTSTAASALPAFTCILRSHSTKTAHMILCLLCIAPHKLLCAFAHSGDFMQPAPPMPPLALSPVLHSPLGRARCTATRSPQGHILPQVGRRATFSVVPSGPSWRGPSVMRAARSEITILVSRMPILAAVAGKIAIVSSSSEQMASSSCIRRR